MSGFLLPRLQSLEPYVPGEQPQGRSYIKLNTNESPFPPSPQVLVALSGETALRLNLYPDPLAARLRRAIGAEYGLSSGQVFVGNGSDEVLGFAFLAYAGETQPVTIPDISYGFYKVYCQLFGVTPHVLPLNPDFTVPVERFCGCGTPVVFANPNAPTGIALPLPAVERIVATNPGHVVLVDEAYVDFGGESAMPLLSQYPNLLIVRTYSKSRSLAGGRLGYALGNEPLIQDLERVKSSFHPYSVNSLTMEAGIRAMENREYFEICVSQIVRTREETGKGLRGLGFTLTESATNFLFAKPPRMGGRAYYEALKERGILVRHFEGERLCDYVRISIGRPEDMERLLTATKEILREAQA